MQITEAETHGSETEDESTRTPIPGLPALPPLPTLDVWRPPQKATDTEDGYPRQLAEGDCWIHVDRHYREQLRGWRDVLTYNAELQRSQREVRAVSLGEVAVSNLYADAFNDLEGMKVWVWQTFRTIGPILGIHAPSEQDKERRTTGRHVVLVHFANDASRRAALQMAFTYPRNGRAVRVGVTERMLRRGAWVVLPLSKQQRLREEARANLQAIEDSNTYERQYCAFSKHISINSSVLPNPAFISFDNLSPKDVPPEFDYHFSLPDSSFVTGMRSTRMDAAMEVLYPEGTTETVQQRENAEHRRRMQGHVLGSVPRSFEMDGRVWYGIAEGTVNVFHQWSTSTRNASAIELEHARQLLRHQDMSFILPPILPSTSSPELLDSRPDLNIGLRGIITRSDTHEYTSCGLNAWDIDPDPPMDWLIDLGRRRQQAMALWRRAQPGRTIIPRVRVDVMYNPAIHSESLGFAAPSIEFEPPLPSTRIDFPALEARRARMDELADVDSKIIPYAIRRMQ